MIAMILKGQIGQMFHGSLNHTGESNSGSVQNGAQLWDYTTKGAIDSSPVVVGGFIYFGSNDDNVYCLNATNGNQIWKYTTGVPVFSSPAITNDCIYFGSEDHNIYCLNAITGKWIWNYETGNLVDSSPAIAGGLLGLWQ